MPGHQMRYSNGRLEMVGYLTGLTIASHTGDGAAALEQVEIIVSEKAGPSKFVWVHAQSDRNSESHIQVARAGSYCSVAKIPSRQRTFIGRRY